MAIQVEDFCPLLRQAIEEARADGLGPLADSLEQVSVATYTTSSEFLGETGRAIVRFLHEGDNAVPRDVAAKLTTCLQHIQTVWPSIRA